MKILREEIKKAASAIVRTDLDISNMRIVFPVDLHVTEYDEFGIEIKSKSSAESNYGNSYITCIVKCPNKVDVAFGYISKNQLISFDLREVLSLTKQEVITEDELKYITSVESFLVPENAVYYIQSNSLSIE